MLPRSGRWTALALTLVGLAAAAPAASQPAASPGEPPVLGEVIEVRTGFVRFLVPADAPPPRAEQIEVVWRRQPQKVVRVVGGEGDPLEVALLVDRSASLHHAFAPLRAAALDLVDEALSEHDRLLALSFTDEPRLLAEGRGEAVRVLTALPTDPEPGTHPTALFVSLAHALTLFGNADARAALIAVTDGCDTAGGLASASAVAARAGELAIPIFLLMPDRDACRFTRCERDVAGELRCTAESGPAMTPLPSSDMFNPAARRMTPVPQSAGSFATLERDRFAGLIEGDGGGAFVVGDRGEWSVALRRIFDRLARQWTVVFEPSSEAVRSQEVRVYARLDGRRKRLR
jgi:hypothetical protein